MSEISEVPTEEKLSQFLQLVLTNVIWIIQMAIPLIARFSSENPRAFLILTTTVLAFTTLRIIRNICTIVRRLMLLSLFVLFVSFYIRGIDTVIGSDLPLLYKLILNDQDLRSVLAAQWSELSRISTEGSQFFYEYCQTKWAALWQEQ